MINLSLTACSFHLKERYSRESIKISNLNKFFETISEDSEKIVYENFIDVINNFWLQNKEYMNDVDDQKLFSCDLKSILIGSEAKYNYFLGKINSGSYGIEAEITDIKTNRIVHKKTNEEADIKEFYIFIAVPKGNEDLIINKGIILFQNISAYGIKTITTKYFREYFKRNFDITFESGNIAPQVYIEKLFASGALKKISFIKNNISSDSSDNINLSYGKEERSITKLSNNEGWKNKILNFLSRKDRIYEFQDINYNQLKMCIENNNSVRTINLNNIDKLSIVDEIPKEVQLISGKPDVEKLVNYFKKVVEDYMEKMIFTIGG